MVSHTLSVLKRDGTPKARAGDMITYQQYCDIVDLKKFQELDEEYGWS